MHSTKMTLAAKLCALTMAMLLILSALCACSETKPSEGGDETTTAAVDLPAEETTDSLYADIPTGDFNKETVHILNLTSSWALTTMTSDDEEGDTITNAVLDRNSILENTVNVELEIEEISGVKAALVNDQDTQAHYYDMIFEYSSNVVVLAQENRLVDFTTMDDLNLDKEWWYPNSSKNLAIGSSMYGLFSDIHLMYHESFYIVAFNKDMLANYPDLADPYDLVNAGNWTIDEMNKMMKTVASDVNADGVKDISDSTSIYGLVAHTNSGFSMLVGFDTSLLEYDENNIPSSDFTGASERFLDGFTKIANTMYDNVLCGNQLSTGYENMTNRHHTPFSEGRALFMYECAGTLKEHRDDSFSYGIVPSPKYDKDQKDYVSPVTYNAACLAVPTGTKIKDDLGVILENMAAISHQKVKPAYYDITLCYKYNRDPEAIAMLNIVYSAGHQERAYVYNFGSLRTTVEGVFKSGKTDVSTQISKSTKLVKNDINKALKNFGLS